jgi:hypothetical protein
MPRYAPIDEGDVLPDVARNQWQGGEAAEASWAASGATDGAGGGRTSVGWGCSAAGLFDDDSAALSGSQLPRHFF